MWGVPIGSICVSAVSFPPICPSVRRAATAIEDALRRLRFGLRPSLAFAVAGSCQRAPPACVARRTGTGLSRSEKPPKGAEAQWWSYPRQNSEKAFFLRGAREPRVEGDDFEELRPRREDDVHGKGAHGVEEADARVGHVAGLPPERFSEVGDGVEREGEQVEDREHGGEI